MFKLVVSDTITVPVAGRLPDAAGNFTPFSFSLTCRRLPADKLRDVLTSEDLLTTEFLRSVVQGWSSVMDEGGHPLEFSAGALDALLNIVGMGNLLYAAYLDACGVKGKAKN